MNKNTTFTSSATVFVWPGESANWYFITLERKVAAAIKEQIQGPRRGFGSVPITVTVGVTTWETSLFPEATSKSFLLPLKAAVRKKEGIQDGDRIDVSFKLR